MEDGGFSPLPDEEGGEGSATGGTVLMVRIVQPIQKPMAKIPRNPTITGIANAQ
jgi:hypothetical protein